MGVKRTAGDQLVRMAKKPKSTAASMAREALKKVNRIEKAEESKADDYSYSTTAAAAGSVHEITLVPQGVLRTERTGDTIMPTKIELGVYGTTITAGTAFRYLVIQANGDFVPNVGAVATDILASGNLTSSYNFTNRHLFRVLYDKLYVIPTIAIAATQSVIGELVDIFPRRRVRYDAATPTYGVGTIDGAIYIIVVGDGNSSTVVSTVRLWYKDA